MENLLLKERRNAVGMTQHQIAEKIGVTDMGYLNYEQGKREPKISTAIKIADALGVSDLRDLWGYTNSK